MDHYTIYHLVAALIVLIVLSGYFSSSETAVMALNRYRLRHLADSGHAGARRTQRLLQRPDRFIGLILLGNNFVNILLTQVATLVTLHLLGEDNLLVATAIITGVIVIFGEVLPKTIAAVNPERIAYPSSLLLLPLLRVAHPVLLVLNAVTGLLLRPFRIDTQRSTVDPLDREELRTVVKEAGALIPQKHRDMLFGLLDLEDATVEDIMVPRAEVVAIDLDRAWVDVAEQIKTCRHTRVPCYRGSLDNVVGILHMRSLGRLFRPGADIDDTDVEALLSPPHYVPMRANLYAQLINFQLAKQRMALAVDEYGDIVGLVTIDDLLEQVVGKFTTVPQFGVADVYRQSDGSFVVDGTANIRELNRGFGWNLPDHGPKTLNGLIIDVLEDIPDAGTSLRIGEYTIEVVHGSDQGVRSARIYPPAHFALADDAPGGRRAQGDEQIGD